MRTSALVLRVAPLVGVPVEELACAADIDPQARELTYQQGVRLWQSLEDLTGDPAIGLTIGQRSRVDTFGMLGMAFASARDLADGLRVVERALPLLLRGGKLSVERNKACTSVVYRMPSVGLRHGVDHMFAAILTLARHCVGSPIVPAAVAFQMPPPATTARYEQLFGITPRFNADRCVLAFTSEDVTRALSGADPGTSQILMDHAETLLASPPNTIVTRAEAALLTSLERGVGTLEDTAKRLATTSRTLQRGLRAYGKSFSVLKDELLEREAKRALKETDESVDSLAARLGYSSRRSFERAFVRWTGQTAGNFRRD